MPTDNFAKRIDQTATNVESSTEIHERNKQLILEFKRDKVLGGLADATILKYITRMKILGEQADKPSVPHKVRY